MKVQLNLPETKEKLYQMHMCIYVSLMSATNEWREQVR